MSTTAPSDPWDVFDYEADMFHAMCDVLRDSNNDSAELSQQVHNAVVESAILHLRQLADILLSRGTRPDDISLTTLIPDWQPAGLDELRQLYGTQSTPACPCWTINKMLAHPTTLRTASYDYSCLLNAVKPIIDGIVRDVRSRRQSALQA
jgi:hypothetical protein